MEVTIWKDHLGIISVWDNKVGRNMATLNCVILDRAYSGYYIIMFFMCGGLYL